MHLAMNGCEPPILGHNRNFYFRNTQKCGQISIYVGVSLLSYLDVVANLSAGYYVEFFPVLKFQYLTFVKESLTAIHSKFKNL